MSIFKTIFKVVTSSSPISSNPINYSSLLSPIPGNDPIKIFATIYKVAKALFEETNTYSTSYISDSEKEFEKKRLKQQLETEVKYFEQILKEENSYEMKEQVKDVLLQSKDFEVKMEYFNAINVLNKYKLVYAEKKSDEKIAKEVERVAKKLIEVREETLNLRK